MKFEANRLMMLEAAKCAAKVAPSSAYKEIINGILIESNSETGEVYLTATNHEVSIQLKVMASVEESGTMLINHRMLTGMLSLMGGDTINISAEGPQVLKAERGRCTLRINCMPASDYPKPIMPFPEESAIMTSICSLAKRTTFLVSSGENASTAHRCVKIKLKSNAVHAVATNGTGLMLTKDIAEPTDEREFLLPGRAFSLLASISKDSDVFEVGDLGAQIVFVRGDMLFTIKKLATGEFMDTTAVLKSIKPAYSALADVSKMNQALSLISVSALSGDERQPINLVLSGKEIILSCNGNKSDLTTEFHANVSKPTPEQGFFYDVPALLKLFQVLSGKVKLEIDTRGVMMIKTQNEVYLQGPVLASMATAAKQVKRRAKGAEGMKEKEAA
jgi:DNA polymerase III sliding clamp (beta) subunit (PCNA family)